MNKQEEYQSRRELKDKKLDVKESKKKAKKYFNIVLIILVVVGVVWGFSWLVKNSPSTPESEIISKRGIHYHLTLEITTLGEMVGIPDNIGLLGARHNPIHTHDDDMLHLEFSGLVKKDNIKLGEFFKVWNKKFNQECIFEFCSGLEGQVKMFVNGKENNEFEDYLMQDNDKIEIRFEK